MLLSVLGEKGLILSIETREGSPTGAAIRFRIFPFSAEFSKNLPIIPTFML